MSELLASLSLDDGAVATRHVPLDDSTIEYGAAARNLEGCSDKPYYITTAIAYTNGAVLLSFTALCFLNR